VTLENEKLMISTVPCKGGILNSYLEHQHEIFVFNWIKFWNRHEVHGTSTHTVCTTQIDKNRHNRTFFNGVGGRNHRVTDTFL